MRRGSIPVISFFCGPGGLDLGFREAGFKPVLALDSSDTAVKTYNKNCRRRIAFQCDLSSTSVAQLLARFRKNLSQKPCGIIGGPPCQSFSRGNVRKKRKDPRSRLVHSFTKLVGELNRKFNLDFIVFENVTGFRSNNGRFTKLKRELRKAGFRPFVKELDAARFRVPQHRRRLLIVGINYEKYPWLRFSFPEGETRTLSVRSAISNLPSPAFYSRGLRRSEIPHHRNHWTMKPRSSKFGKRPRAKGRSFRRLRWHKPSMTVAYGHREIHIHPDGNRRLSIYEAMLLQGFPATYELLGSLSAQVKQVSDAVPPPLAEALATAIWESLYARIFNLQRALRRWFSKNGRQFPWRKISDPFSILIAEKLLQQTAANRTVVDVFQKTIKTYATPAALAKAKVKKLKKLIAPLGFHYRAGELIRLAKELVAAWRGEVPSNLTDLKLLPGVGDYSARAVLAFGFNQTAAVVDTNIARFLFRFFGLKGDLPKNPARNRSLQRIADALVPVGDAKQFNLALLDLCAAHCKARQPQCGGCPVRRYCTHFNQQALAKSSAQRRKRQS